MKSTSICEGKVINYFGWFLNTFEAWYVHVSPQIILAHDN